ncbi:MAG: hypothetical protein RLZZ15_4034 [Verrucomicrobiota bacterium]
MPTVVGMKKKTAAESRPYPLDNHQDNAFRVEDGVPVADLVVFGRETGFTIDELAKLVQIPPRTYARRVASKARLSLPEGERAVRVMRLYDRAKELFGTHENTREWLNAEVPALGWRTPLSFARTEQGARAVEDLIGRIEHGIPS